MKKGPERPSTLGEAPPVHGAPRLRAGASAAPPVRSVFPGVLRPTGLAGTPFYRDGVAVKFVEPLDRMEVREVSLRFLSQQETIEIADLHRKDVGVREIARRIGRSRSTISRELKRNRTEGRRPGYRPAEARRRACSRRARRRARRPQTNDDLGGSSPNYSSGAGAPSRSADSCANASPSSRRCGSRTRASTEPSMSPARR